MGSSWCSRERCYVSLWCSHMPMFGQLYGTRVQMVSCRPQWSVCVPRGFQWCDYMLRRCVVLHCSDSCLPGCDILDNGISSGRQPENRHQKGWLMIWTTGPGEDRALAGVGGVGGGGHATCCYTRHSHSLSCITERKLIHSLCHLHPSELFLLPTSSAQSL